MAKVRHGNGRFHDDRFVRMLGHSIWCAPLAIFLSLSAHLTTEKRTLVAPAPVAREVARRSDPIETRAVLRPRREASPREAVAAAPTPDRQLLAMAFMPMVDVAVAKARTAAPPAALDLPTASTPARPPRPKISLAGRPWRMETLRRVGVSEGLRLISDGAFFNLAGVAPLDPGATCKRIDGVVEPCSLRAISRLEVLTRGRTVTCRVYDAFEGEAPYASCRADKIDIADDLVKNGLARRSDA
jgi:endonuclease YncB( thermonuclease family)